MPNDLSLNFADAELIYKAKLNTPIRKMREEIGNYKLTTEITILKSEIQTEKIKTEIFIDFLENSLKEGKIRAL